MQEGDDITQIKEVGDDGLFTESDKLRFKECSVGVFRGGVLTPGQIRGISLTSIRSSRHKLMLFTCNNGSENELQGAQVGLCQNKHNNS